jgi:hypothetical protein
MKLSEILEAAHCWHLIMVTSDPSDASTCARCTCGWEHKVPFINKTNFGHRYRLLASEVEKHLLGSLREHRRLRLEIRRDDETGHQAAQKLDETRRQYETTLATPIKGETR